MSEIVIRVRNRVAQSPEDFLVCGNSDYKIRFDLDAEWNEHAAKTARFVHGGKATDVVFVGDVCDAPVFSDVTMVAVGVYAGDLRTTTPALISCRKSILCGNAPPADLPPDVFEQMSRLFENGLEDCIESAKIAKESAAAAIVAEEAAATAARESTDASKRAEDQKKAAKAHADYAKSVADEAAKTVSDRLPATEEREGVWRTICSRLNFIGKSFGSFVVTENQVSMQTRKDEQSIARGLYVYNDKSITDRAKAVRFVEDGVNYYLYGEHNPPALMKLLWSSSGSSAARTVSLDLSAYDAVFIQFTSAYANLSAELFCKVGDKREATMAHHYNSQRTVEVTKTGVVFDACYYAVRYGENSYGVSREYLFPQRIYGIKGVK